MKDGKGLHNGNVKTLKKETKENTTWKGLHVHGSKSWKYPFYQGQFTYSVKSSQNGKKKNIKTHIEAQKIPDSKNNPEQKKKSFRNNFTPDFEFYYKCLVIKTSWDGHQSRHRDMQNGMENPDIRIHHHSLGKRQYLPPAVLGRLNISMQNNKIRSLPLTLHQSQLQMG